MFWHLRVIFGLTSKLKQKSLVRNLTWYHSHSINSTLATWSHVFSWIYTNNLVAMLAVIPLAISIGPCFFALVDLPCFLPPFQAHLVWLQAILSLAHAATRTDLLLCSLSTDNHHITHMPPIPALPRLPILALHACETACVWQGSDPRAYNFCTHRCFQAVATNSNTS